MDEQFAEVGRGITLCYERLGDPQGEPLLLVMGLGTQMIAWADGLCDLLVQRGFCVVRFDNRDIGRSTKLRHLPPPGPLDLVLRRSGAAGYRLSDMADDAAGLIDHLGWEAAHVVGASMGGMIAQTLAARHPAKVRSLVSIMSNTGNRWTGQPAPQVLPTFLKPPPASVDEAVERSVALFRVVGSPGFARDEDELRRLARLAGERGKGDTAGSGRQLMAILASGDRTKELGTITAPTLVVHGKDDKLVRLSGGIATKKAIPGSRLEVIDGMGHDLPRELWPRLTDLIAEHARSAGLGARSAAAA